MKRTGTKDDLFAVQDGDPIREWTALAKELETFQPTLLGRWKQEYDCWRHHYQRFRDCEQKTLYTATKEGEIPKPSEHIMRLHRRSVLALLQSGEQCADQLDLLPLEGEEAKERLDLVRRIRTLLDALQESLELWHPVNMERVEQKKAIFN